MRGFARLGLSLREWLSKVAVLLCLLAVCQAILLVASEQNEERAYASITSPAAGSVVSGLVTITESQGGQNQSSYCGGATTTITIYNSANQVVAYWTTSNPNTSPTPNNTPLSVQWLTNTVPNGAYTIVSTSTNTYYSGFWPFGSCQTQPGPTSSVSVTVSNGPEPFLGAPGATPSRPPQCPPTPNTNNSGGTDGLTSTTTGVVPWPPAPSGTNPENYSSYLHTAASNPPVRPQNWAVDGVNWQLTSAQTSDTSTSNQEPAGIDLNPQELCGVMGMSVDLAWQTTTGRPDVVIASLDSGIEECNPSIVNKLYLNRKALPYPENAQGLTKPQLQANGQSFPDNDPYDLNGTGVFNAAQYANDPRVTQIANYYGGLFCVRTVGTSANYVSPEDLILTFGTPTLPNGQPNPYYYPNCPQPTCTPAYPGQSPPGFTEAISGWNFVDDNNNPYDLVHYDHGTGEANGMAGAADVTGSYAVGSCPNCMVMPVRAGDSFMTSGNWFAEAVLFAVDSGATLISSAQGGFDFTPLDQEAVNYALAHGVPVLTSAADEESNHHNIPTFLQHMIVVNSVTAPPQVTFPQILGSPVISYSPGSYLELNGCTNFGANITVAVESWHCSSDATAKMAGILGLAESAARNAVQAGTLANYPGLTDANGNPVPLSADEVKQLASMSADSVDFADSAGPQPGATCGGCYPPTTANNYQVSTSVILGAATLPPTRRFPSHAGFNQFFGYGRVNAARLIGEVSAGLIPPEARIDSPSWFQVFDPTSGGSISLVGRVAAVRASSYTWQLLAGIGPDPTPDKWTLLASGSGSGGPAGALSGVLATIPLSTIASLFPPGTDFSAPPVLPNGQPNPDAATFTLLLQVQDNRGLVGMDRMTDFLHTDPSLVPGFPRQMGASVVGAPKLAPIGPNGQSVLLVARADGTLDALMPDGTELPGWPVHANPMGFHSQEPAFASGAIPDTPRCEFLGTPAAGNLSGSSVAVVETDFCGNVYAWSVAGQPLPGWPVHTNPNYCGPAVENPANRVFCGFFGGPALADLLGNGQLDVVAASTDRHVYAWTPNGQLVPGWPVLVVDPSKVAAVDPTTNQVTFSTNSNFVMGTKLIDTPAIGNLNGANGPPDVVVGSNEQYSETPNTSTNDPFAVACVFNTCYNIEQGGNSRVYAIAPTGNNTSPNCFVSASGATTSQPSACAFLAGWPVQVADWLLRLLPDVGDGVSNSPVLGSLAGNGKLQTAVNADAGPETLINPDGSSYLGTSGGNFVTAAVTPYGPGYNSSNSTCYSQDSGDVGGGYSIPALGGPSMAPLGNGTTGLSVLAPGLSSCRGLDTGLPEAQLPPDSHLIAWNSSGGLLSAFPQLMNDMQFLDQPIVANLGYPGDPYAIEASSVYDVRAINALGQEAPGFPKFTGGWVVNSPAVGQWGSLPNQVLVAGTREGYLFAWTTAQASTGSAGPWPTEYHDLANTSNASFPPPVVTAVNPSQGMGGTVVTISGSNFSGAVQVMFGSTPASSFVVNSSSQITAVAPPGALGTTVDVQVLTPAGGLSATSPADRFTYVGGAPVALTPITPVRICDTRASSPANQCNGGGRGTLNSGTTMSVQVAGTAGIPSGATAAVLNVTVTDVQGLGGYLTIWPAGTPQPQTSVINFQAGDTRANLVVTGLGPNGQISVFAQGTVDVIIDVLAYGTPAPTQATSGRFVPVTPTTIIDTRPGSGMLGQGLTLGPNQALTLSVLGAGPIPTSGVAGLVLTVTATNTVISQGSASFLSVLPALTTTPPTTSSMNWIGPAQSVTNKVLVPIGPNGSITFYNASGAVDVVASVDGYITATSGQAAQGYLLVPLQPTRICDTRSGWIAFLLGTQPNQCNAGGNGTLLPGGSLAVNESMLSLPVNPAALATTVTVTDNPAPGTAVLSVPSLTPPAVPDVAWGYPVPETTAGAGFGPVDPNGSFTLTNQSTGPIDAVIDVEGYFR